MVSHKGTKRAGKAALAALDADGATDRIAVLRKGLSAQTEIFVSLCETKKALVPTVPLRAFAPLREPEHA
jgi:hypothetical protein